MKMSIDTFKEQPVVQKSLKSIKKTSKLRNIKQSF